MRRLYMGFRGEVIQGKFITGVPIGLPRPGPGVSVIDPTSFRLNSVGGNHLPPGLRGGLESFFRADFSGVRVHTIVQAKMIGALALTRGDNIYFAPGQYQPNTRPGISLLAHELAHVIQQRTGRARNPQGRGLAIVQDSTLEAEADRLGQRAAASLAIATGRPMVHSVQAKPAIGTRLAGPAVQLPMPPGNRPRPNFSKTIQPKQPLANIPKPATFIPPSNGVIQRGVTKNTRRKPSTTKRRVIKSKKFSRAYLDRQFKAPTLNSKVTFTGRWTPIVTLSGTKGFAQMRRAQSMRHISVQTYWYIKNALGQTKEQEVQAMSINDRVIIASNIDGSMAEFASHLQAKADAFIKMKSKRTIYLANPKKFKPVSEPIHPLQEIFQTEQEQDERAIGVAKKFSSVFSGKRLVGEPATEFVRSLIKAEDFFAELNLSSSSACKNVITDPSYQNKIILITSGGGDLHAEQKLLIALLKSGSKALANIFGKKRPCVGCGSTLYFAKHILGLNILFNPHSGGYWATATKGFMELINKSPVKINQEQAIDKFHDYAKQVATYQTLTLKSKQKRSSLKTKTIKFTSGQTIDTSATGYDSGSDSEPD